MARPPPLGVSGVSSRPEPSGVPQEGAGAELGHRRAGRSTGCSCRFAQNTCSTTGRSWASPSWSSPGPRDSGWRSGRGARVFESSGWGRPYLVRRVHGPVLKLRLLRVAPHALGNVQVRRLAERLGALHRLGKAEVRHSGRVVGVVPARSEAASARLPLFENNGRVVRAAHFEKVA